MLFGIVFTGSAIAAATAKILGWGGLITGGTYLGGLGGIKALDEIFKGYEGTKGIDYDGKKTLEIDGLNSGADHALNLDETQRAQRAIDTGALVDGELKQNLLAQALNWATGQDPRQIEALANNMQREKLRNDKEIKPLLNAIRSKAAELEYSADEVKDLTHMTADADKDTYKDQLIRVGARLAGIDENRNNVGIGVDGTDLLGDWSKNGIPTQTQINALSKKWKQQDPDGDIQKGIRRRSFEDSNEQRAQAQDYRLSQDMVLKQNQQALNEFQVRSNVHQQNENRRLQKWQLEQAAREKQAELNFRKDTLVFQAADKNADRSLQRQLAIIEGERQDRRARMRAFEQLGRGLTNSMQNFGGYIGL